MLELLILGLIVAGISLAIGTMPRSDLYTGALTAVFLAYPALNTALPTVRQSTFLIVLVVAIAACAVGQRLAGVGRSREVSLPFWVAIGTLSTLIGGTFAPAVADADKELRLWLTVLAGLVALALCSYINIRALTVGLLACEVFVLIELSGNDPNKIWVARVAMLAAVFTALSVRRAYFVIPMLVVQSVVLVWIGEQGPQLGLILAIGFLLVQNRSGWARASILLLSTSSALVILIYPDWLAGVWGTVNSQGTGTERLQLIGQAINQWSTSPIFGHGFASFIGYTQRGLYYYPHNDFFEILADLGLFGALLLVWALLVGWIGASKTRLLPAYLAALACAMVSGGFVINHEVWVVVVIAGALEPLALRRVENDLKVVLVA